MPVGLLTLRTATLPELEGYHDDPRALYDFVNGIIGRAGAQLDDLYFDIGRERAYALVRDLDDYITVKAVTRILGAEDYNKMITVDQAVEAVQREQKIRGSSGSSS
jgi:hypothetical protein